MDTNIKQINGVDLASPVADADALAAGVVLQRMLAVLMAYNGATLDRVRSVSDGADGQAALTTGVLAAVARLQAWNGSQYNRLFAAVPGDADSNTISMLQVNARGTVFNGATWDRARTPTTFKSFASTAITAGTGATIWTPAAGKKFRLMGYAISSSVAGVLIFGDNLVATVIARSAAVAAAGIAADTGGWGNGMLSAAANNVLKLDGPTGNVAGMVWGTEE